MNKNKAFIDWMKRNEKDLMADYHQYRIAHDYCVGNTAHAHFHRFESWARHEFEMNHEIKKCLEQDGII